jgi:hypothetical protein
VREGEREAEELGRGGDRGVAAAEAGGEGVVIVDGRGVGDQEADAGGGPLEDQLDAAVADDGEAVEQGGEGAQGVVDLGGERDGALAVVPLEAAQDVAEAHGSRAPRNRFNKATRPLWALSTAARWRASSSAKSG